MDFLKVPQWTEINIKISLHFIQSHFLLPKFGLSTEALLAKMIEIKINKFVFKKVNVKFPSPLMFSFFSFFHLVLRIASYSDESLFILEASHLRTNLTFLSH